MGIIALLILLMFYIINQVASKHMRKVIVIKIALALIIQSFFLIIYRFELSDLGRVVYYSDAEIYWNHTLSYLSGNVYYAYNDVYIWISYFLQKTSPFVWVGWMNIYNVLILNISILICTLGILSSLKDSDFAVNEYTIKKNVSRFLNWTLFNPLILYSLMRNLKDATYLFMVLIIIYFLMILQNKKSRLLWILYYSFLLLMTVLLYGIRPWAFISVIFALYFIVEKQNKSHIKRFLWIVFLAVVSVLITISNSKFMRIYYSTAVWVPIIFNSASEQTVLEKITSIPRLLIGPGPIRSLFGSTYFLYYTKVGNYMSFIGSSMWWIQVSFMISKVVDTKLNYKKLSMFSKYILLNLIAYILIYAMAYGGSSELRFRGVLYVLISALFFSSFSAKLDKKLLLKSSFILVVVTLGGLLFG